MTGEEMLDEGKHLFDVALASGIDSGRYRLVVDPEHPSKTRMVAGPNFLLLPPGSWIAERIDEQIRAGRPDASA